MLPGTFMLHRKRKKKPTRTGERNQTEKKKKKCKKCQKAKPKPDSINQPTTGRNISTIIVWLPGKLHIERKDMIMRSTSMHTFLRFCLICLGKSKFVEIVLLGFRVQCKWNPEPSFLRRYIYKLLLGIYRKKLGNCQSYKLNRKYLILLVIIMQPVSAQKDICSRLGKG